MIAGVVAAFVTGEAFVAAAFVAAAAAFVAAAAAFVAAAAAFVAGISDFGAKFTSLNTVIKFVTCAEFNLLPIILVSRSPKFFKNTSGISFTSAPPPVCSSASFPFISSKRAAAWSSAAFRRSSSAAAFKPPPRNSTSGASGFPFNKVASGLCAVSISILIAHFPYTN